MDKKVVEAGNKAIAEFMGLKTYISPHGFDYCNTLFILTEYGKETGKYHKSWDWIMPVVERVRGLQKDDFKDIDNQLLENRKAHVTHLRVTESIETIWDKCVVFAKWYNSKTESE